MILPSPLSIYPRSLAILLLSGGVFGLASPSQTARAEDTTASGATQITSVPYSITTPGTYYLAQDFSINTTSAISVSASNVTIDFNGHTLTSTNTNSSSYPAGIQAGNTSSLTVRNGTINGFTYGVITTSSSSYGHLIEKMTFVNNTEGCLINGSGCRISHCRAVVNTTPQTSVEGFEMQGSENIVEDCEVSSVGSVSVTGVHLGNGTNGLVVNNRFFGLGAAITGANATYKYRDNLTSGVTNPYGLLYNSTATDAGNNN